MWPISYASVILQKKAGGLRVHCFWQKYEGYSGKNTTADSQIFKFSKMARIAFLTMPSLRPFNGLSRHFKLELLTSDSFYCQGGSENFIRARYYEKVRVKNHYWSNYTGKITKIRAIFSKHSYIRACSYLYGWVGHTAFVRGRSTRMINCICHM